MRLKPTFPIIEILVPPMLIFFAVQLTQLAVEKSEWMITLGSVFFILLAGVTVYFINRNFQTLELGDKLVSRGFFWGQREAELGDLKGYKLKEIWKTRYLVKDFNLVLVDNDNEVKFKITQSDYNTNSFDNFLTDLRGKRVDFLGQETMKDHLRGYWRTIFKKGD
jgi:hypothetical protein